MNSCNSYYGGYRTRTFADIFPDVDTFKEEWYNTAFSADDAGTMESLSTFLPKIYYMLYAHYGNSHIAFSDENQFKYYVWSLLYQYGPTAVKEREIQDVLVKMTEEELVLGGKAIYNHSYNPNTEPSTSTLEELLTINDQNTTNYKKSKLEGYATLQALLKKDVLDEFIHRFSKLFIKVLAPDYPLYYVTEEDDN